MFTRKIISFSVILCSFGLIAVVVMLVVRQPQPRYVVNFSSQTVIKEIKSLNRLETASFTIEKIIDAGTSGSSLKNFFYGDKILLIAHGKVIAGFDLSKISEQDIQIDGSKLMIKLPPPEILLTALDNEQTRVYDRQTGILTKGDKDLESQARSEAEVIIKDAACKGNILTEATNNAKSQLMTLFKSLGFTEVILDIPQGSC